ncbi:peptidoglycan-binding protein [Geobacter benzoatilyticus]|uniref:Peptidoglycan-binding protein n=1 Tax=Geobacter benzoatilyticus TaxID=2815309 RepID=A0ABX7Q7M3_9BACT|nr:peptidoglycan-binding protein [Geobacter benzoatilyticus]QSV47048.1 peptidoglycan-binding protein [Geobacter benzoatilyticus]
MGKRISRKHDTQKPPKSEYTKLVNIDKDINNGLHSAPGTFVEQLLGNQSNILPSIKYVNVGPFKVNGHIQALESLKQIMSVVKTKYPDLYGRLAHNGMHVPKNIAGKKSKSLHSWGIAIDITIDGIEDVKWNEMSFYGLALMAPIFHDHGWYWGGAFRDQETEKGSGVYWTNEDAMHFEVSKEKLLEWHNAGLLGPVSTRRPEAKIPESTRPTSTSSSSHHRSMFDWLQRGDKGPKVVRLQEALKSHGHNLKSDGNFGGKTEAALIKYQRQCGLPANGIVGPKTAAYLLFF